MKLTDFFAGKVCLAVCCLVMMGISVKESEQFARFILSKVTLEQCHKENVLRNEI